MLLPLEGLAVTVGVPLTAMIPIVNIHRPKNWAASLRGDYHCTTDGLLIGVSSLGVSPWPAAGNCLRSQRILPIVHRSKARSFLYRSCSGL